MPDMSQAGNADCEKRLAHNNVEKKRKDKLKSALDELRKFMPSSITKIKKLSHHEVLLKAIEYMRELEDENKKLLSGASDTVKGMMPTVDVIQSWKSKGKVNKACQASRGFAYVSGKSSLSHLMSKNKKQKKGLTIAQRLNHASELFSIHETCPKMTAKSYDFLNSHSTPQCGELCTSLEVPTTRRLAGKESNALFLCYNDRLALGVPENVQITPVNIISTQPTQHEISVNVSMSNSVISIPGQTLPFSSLSLLPCLNAGISYLQQPTISNGANSEYLNGQDIHEENKDNSGDDFVEKCVKKQKCSGKAQKGYRVLHCCNWYWKNMRWRRRVRKFYAKRKSMTPMANEEVSTPPRENNNISVVDSLITEDGKNIDNVYKEKNADPIKDNNVITETFDSSSSNTSKVNKPIWIVAKNMTGTENGSSLSKGCEIDDSSPSKGSSEQNIKMQPISPRVQFEAVSSDLCSLNSQLKNGYQEIGGLPLNPISSFSDLYDRNSSSKMVDQSFIEEASFYGSGVQYLNEDNELHFEIEDDMFPQPSNSPFTSQVPYEKVKHKEGRKDFLSFSFHNDVFSSNTFAPSDSFVLQSSFNSSDKGTCTNSMYRQISPQNSISLSLSTYSNNVHHSNSAFSNIEFRVTKPSSAIYTQSYSTTGKPVFIHTSEKIDYSKNETSRLNKESNSNCMFDSLDKSHFGENLCSVNRFQNKESKNFNPDLKLVQNSSYASPQFEAANAVSVFNPYSNYSYDKVWTHNSSMSLFTPKANLIFQDSHANTQKNSENSQLFSSHFSSFPVSKFPADKDSSKTKTGSDYFESIQTNEDDATTDSATKFQNSLNKEKVKSYQSGDFSLLSEGTTKVAYNVNNQLSFATKLWNPDQYALNSKPFSFYPLSYNDNISKTAFNTKHTSSAEKISGSLQLKIMPETGMSRSDALPCSITFSNRDDAFKSSSHILSFVPPIKTSLSTSHSCEESEGLSLNVMPSNNASNTYPLIQSDLQIKTSDPSNWSKSAFMKSGNFAPYFSCSGISENVENNFFQPSPAQKFKVNSFSSGSVKSLVNPILNSGSSKSSLKKINSSSSKTPKKFQKVTSQELFSKCQKSSYYSNQNSHYSSDLLVGAFDKPTYLTNEDQFIPSYNSSEQVTDLNINPFVPPLPSHQTNDVRLNLYQNQSHCTITGFPSTTTPPLTLSSTKFSSALPSIHHFGISNIFNDLSHPLTLAVEASNLTSLKVSQGEPFMSSPHYYRDNAIAEAVMSTPSSGLFEGNYYPHVPNIFNHHAMKHTNSISKHSMSINNLLGN